VHHTLEGQAESGKSTVLKNFQLQFSPKAFQAQTLAWRPVIQLNLVRSVNFILDLLGVSNPSLHGSVSFGASSPTLNDDVRRLCMKLVPLRTVEETLIKQLGGSVPLLLDASEPLRYHPAKASEVSIRSDSGWKVFMKFRSPSEESNAPERLEDSQTRRIINACADDIVGLWADQTVQSCLSDQGILLEDQPGLFVFLFVRLCVGFLTITANSFLSDVTRIASEDYNPTSGESHEFH
jgi:hypothetical protein